MARYVTTQIAPGEIGTPYAVAYAAVCRDDESQDQMARRRSLRRTVSESNGLLKPIPMGGRMKLRRFVLDPDRLVLRVPKTSMSGCEKRRTVRAAVPSARPLAPTCETSLCRSPSILVSSPAGASQFAPVAQGIERRFPNSKTYFLRMVPNRLNNTVIDG